MTTRSSPERLHPFGTMPARRAGLGWPALADWSGLFWSAFRTSRNAMALVDDGRMLVDVNGAFLRLVGRSREELLGRPVTRLVVGGPRLSAPQWRAALASGRFTGQAELVHADGGAVAVQWGASTEVVTGRRIFEIAEELQIAHDTVRTHVRNAMDRLGARSRAHLVAKALGGGHIFV